MIWENKVLTVLMCSFTELDSDIQRVYIFLLRNILLWSDLAPYNFVKVSQISLAVFFSSRLDSMPSARAKCRLAIALSSISFHLASMISFGLSSIAGKQPFFLKIAFIFNFHNEKLLQLNFSISYFATILFSLIICLLKNQLQKSQ